MTPSVRRGLALAIAALAIAPASAHAASATFAGGKLTITGTAAVEKISVSTGSNASYTQGIRIYDTNGPLTVSGGTCVNQGSGNAEIWCPEGSITSIDATMGSGDDAYSNYLSGIADTISGGDGNDSLSGKVAGDDAGKAAVDLINGDGGNDELSAGSGEGTTCNGGIGNDRLICFYVPAGQVAHHNGGPGNDDITGGDSNDVIHGNEGNETRLYGGKGDDQIFGDDGDDGSIGVSDNITGGPGADVISGGAGIDRVVEDRNEDLKQYWSLDDVANDGSDSDANGAADEGDNIKSDVENFKGGYDDDTIVGSGANNVLDGGTLGNDLVYGLGGDDELYGGVSGTDVTDGGEGNDKVSGNGHVIGGNGNDELNGYGDNGLLEPGPGTDTVSAGAGNDVVRAVDGAVDTIGCGVGADIAEVDSTDVVNTNDDGDNCEQVKVTAAAGGGTGQNGAGNPNATAVQMILGATGALKGVKATFSATAPGPGVIQATVTTAGGKAARAAAAKATVLGKANKVVAKAGKVSIAVKLKGKAFKKLKRKKKFKVVLTTRFTPPGGTPGPAVKKTVTLKRR